MSYDFLFLKKNHNNIFMSVLYRFWYIGLYVVGLGKFKISQTKTPPFLFFSQTFFSRTLNQFLKFGYEETKQHHYHVAFAS